MSEPTASEIIDALGGTSAVATLCDIKPPSVSEWRREGIPPARMAFFRLLRPDVFPKPTADPEPSRETETERRLREAQEENIALRRVLVGTSA